MKLKQLLKKILTLLLDLFLLGVDVSTQIILPGKKEKGNILSSLLDLFVGIVERLFHFKHGFFQLKSLFKLRVCRQALVLVTTLLFLVSSLEWTGQPTRRSAVSNDEQHECITCKKVMARDRDAYCLGIASANENYSGHGVISRLSKKPANPSKKYLLNASFLI